MKLRDARLCLDCEELHADEQCPHCASEAFAFVTRWIPPTQRGRDRGRGDAASRAADRPTPASAERVNR